MSHCLLKWSFSWNWKTTKKWRLFFSVFLHFRLFSVFEVFWKSLMAFTFCIDFMMNGEKEVWFHWLILKVKNFFLSPVKLPFWRYKVLFCVMILNKTKYTITFCCIYTPPKLAPPLMSNCLIILLLIRSDEHTSELQSHSEIYYSVFFLNKKKTDYYTNS